MISDEDLRDCVRALVSYHMDERVLEGTFAIMQDEEIAEIIEVAARSVIALEMDLPYGLTAVRIDVLVDRLSDDEVDYAFTWNFWLI